MRIDVSSVTSHFPNPQDGFTTTTSGPVTSGGSTVGLNSTGDYTNGDVVVLIIDPTDSDKKQVFVGTIDTAGVQVTNVVWVGGTNQSHSSGATVVDYYDAAHVRMVTKGLLVAHNQDGTLKDGAVDSAAVLASNVVETDKILNDAVTDDKLDYPRWYQQIGRQTLESSGDTITISGLPARKYLCVVISLLDTGGTINASLRFNGDTGNNYAVRASTEGAADATATSASSIGMTQTGAFPHFVVMEIVNIGAKEKVFYARTVTSGTSGAGNLPGRVETSGKWANTANQISSITLTNSGTGDFAIGSEIVVLGHD